MGFKLVRCWRKSRSEKLETPQATELIADLLSPWEATESALPKCIQTEGWQLKMLLLAVMAPSWALGWVQEVGMRSGSKPGG